jgi:glutamate/tyrosine decarboxylase-like PLP-dependent enzyme
MVSAASHALLLAALLQDTAQDVLTLQAQRGGPMGVLPLPKAGMDASRIMQRLAAFKENDTDWHQGHMFNLIYDAGEEVEALVKQAHTFYLIENGLNPMAFPSLVTMETEVVAMVLSLTGGDAHSAGNLTSGGTESIFMALKAARDWARFEHPQIEKPEMIVPLSIHPAWNKSAHYLGIKIVTTPVTADFKADVDAVRAAITPNTIIIGATAVTYPHGVVDPIVALGRLARQHNLWLHVDACLGGLILPFLAQLGYPVPAYGLNVDGVSSVSADIHKYAYTPKGVSVVMYRSAALRKHQLFVYTDWPGGVYATPCLAGARSGGSIAAAWAVLHYLGEDGFLRLAQKAKTTADKLIEGINATPGLFVLGRPDATVFAFGSHDLHIYELGERLKRKGWHVEAQHLPPSLHMTVSPRHATVVDDFLTDLRALEPETPRVDEDDISDTAAMYAMLGTLPDRSMAKEMALDFVNELYYTKPLRPTEPK